MLSRLSRYFLQSPTLKLFLLNLLVYLLTSLIGGSFIETNSKIIAYFALSLDPSHYWFIWTPITSLFIHGNLLHLATNLALLLIVGMDLENKEYNKKIIYIDYFICGLLAGPLSLLIFYDPSFYTLGASGSIFGLLGMNVGIERNQNESGSLIILIASLIALAVSIGVRVNVYSHVIGFIFGFLIGINNWLNRFKL